MLARALRYVAALAFASVIMVTGFLLSQALGVDFWLGGALWLSIFIYLYLEFVASLQERAQRLGEKLAKQQRPSEE